MSVCVDWLVSVAFDVRQPCLNGSVKHPNPHANGVLDSAWCCKMATGLLILYCCILVSIYAL